MAKPVLMVDMDDVLYPCLEFVCTAYNASFGTSFTIADLTDYQLYPIFGTTQENMRRFIHNALQTPLARAQVPLPGALAAISDLCARYTIISGTARIEKLLRKCTMEWFDAFFGDHISECIFFDLFEGRYRSKAEYCSQMGIRLIVDDYAVTIRACGEAGMNAVLFGDYPWNQTNGTPLPRGSIRAPDWEAAKKHLLS